MWYWEMKNTKLLVKKQERIGGKSRRKEREVKVGGGYVG